VKQQVKRERVAQTAQGGDSTTVRLEAQTFTAETAFGSQEAFTLTALLVEHFLLVSVAIEAPTALEKPVIQLPLQLGTEGIYFHFLF